MSLQKDDQARQDFLSITLKALRDESYKERLVADPAKGIQELFPEFNTDIEIVVQDQTKPGTIYLNISPTEAAFLYEGIEDLELNEEDLELVAGGLQQDGNGNCGVCTITNAWYSCWGA